MSDKRDDLIKKIQALRERTVENGCSENEAISAAKMLSKLMEKHGIAFPDLGEADAPKHDRIDRMALKAGYVAGEQININNQIGE